MVAEAVCVSARSSTNIASETSSKATVAIAISLSTEPLLAEGCSGALAHESIDAPSDSRLCSTVSSSSSGATGAAETIIPGLRPFASDGFDSCSIEWPHFQQNEYFISIIAPQSGHGLATGPACFATTGGGSGSSFRTTGGTGSGSARRTTGGAGC